MTIGLMLASSVAVAADSPQQTVTVQGREFAVFVRQGAAIAIPAQASAGLVRDIIPNPPACDTVQTVMAPYTGHIALCKNSGNPNGTHCRQLRDMANYARFNPGVIGRTQLDQYWDITPSAPVGGPSADDIRAAVAAAAGVALDAATYRDSVSPNGTATSMTLVVAPNSTSWASKLHGVGTIDLQVGKDGVAGVVYNVDGQFVTNDHVLACGLLAGDVKIQWRQPSTATVQLRGDGPFTPSDLWRVYQALSSLPVSDEQDPIRRATEVGARIGVALQSTGLAAGAQLDARVSFVLNGFFRGDALQFEAGLSRRDVEERATGLVEVTIAPDVPWSSSSVR
jgi:hypothetical protein